MSKKSAIDQKLLLNLFIFVFGLMSILFGVFYAVVVTNHFLVPTGGILIGEAMFIIALMAVIVKRIQIA